MIELNGNWSMVRLSDDDVLIGEQQGTLRQKMAYPNPIFRQRDKKERKFVAGIRHSRNLYEITGWFYGYEAMKKEFEHRLNKNAPQAYIYPTSLLRDIRSLYNEIHNK